MPNAFFVEVSGNTVRLDDIEVNHLRVIRAKKGDRLTGTDGRGGIYKFVLEGVGKHEATGTVIEKEFVERDGRTIIIAVAATKWPRLRILLEKATELGVDRIELFQGRRSVALLDGEKLSRYTAVVREAAKQSVNPYLPSVELQRNLDLSGAQNLLLDFRGKPLRELSKELATEREIRLIVGPEGGFTEEEISEISAASVKVSLGRRTLRVETAMIVALGLLNDYTERI